MPCKIDKLGWIMANIKRVKTPAADPPWIKQTMADLERHEGYREYAYPDPLSVIGQKYKSAKHRWGFRPASVIMKELGITNPAQGAPWTVGFGFTKGVTPTTRTTRAESYARLRDEVIEHVKGLDTLIPGWRTEHEVYVQTVLANLIFNLGTVKLSKFAPTLALFAKKDYKGAAARLKRTAWYGQVGSRAVELTERLTTGKIQDKYKI